MTVEEGAEENEDDEKRVLVGIQINENSRELLNWALAKVAEPGDRVVAVHVCQDSDSHAIDHSSAIGHSLDSYLAVYEGFCDVKKALHFTELWAMEMEIVSDGMPFFPRLVNLVGQISWGNSIRKVLVREAKLCAAKALVVGIKFNALGGSLSLARYCAKKLPPTTSVLAVHKGKVVFQKDSIKQSSGPGQRVRFVQFLVDKLVFMQLASPRVGLKGNRWPSFHSLLHLRIGDDSKVLNPSHKEMPDDKIPKVLEAENLASQPVYDSEDSGRNFKEIASEPGSMLTEKDDAAKSDGTETGSFSSSAIQSTIEMESVKEVEDEDNHLSQEQKDDVSCSSSIRKLPEDSHGWPLLRRTISPNSEAVGDNEARDMSVVQWVMSLPNRSLLFTPQPQIGLEPHRKELHRNRRKSTASSLSTWLELPTELETLIATCSTNCRVFSREELESSITHFAPENLIGKGGCGQVYKGCLPDGQQVAVKISKSSKKAWEDFLLEVNIITSLQHKHITPLIGICVEDNVLISIYEFFQKGSLEEHLHGGGEKSILPWEVRFKVAVGVAEALTYLHQDCSRPVIHRDVKSSNVLLSDEFEPQLSDFGLALWAPTSAFVTHTDVVGTFGYLAPEYFMCGKISEKIDVYSFGVILLELLSGRKPINTENPKRQESLVMWATPKLESGDALDLLDPKLSREIDENQMRRMVLATTLCITRTAPHRPQMSEILKLLQGDEDTVEWAKSEVRAAKESESQDEEAYPIPCGQSHCIDLALLEADDDKTSFSSIEQNSHHYLDDYLQGQWSHSSGFD